VAIYFFTLLSFAACYLVGVFACRLRPLDYPYGAESRLGHIDGLRGYLALLVFAMHFATTRVLNLEGHWGYAPQHGMRMLGEIGVALFFMVTGYLFIFRILDKAGRVDWRGLYISRVFRIYPVYLLFVAIVFLLSIIVRHWVVYGGIGEWLSSFAGWMSFGRTDVNGIPAREMVVMGVQWTLQYEWLFYLLLPLIAVLLRWRMTTGLLVVLVAAGAIYPQNAFGFSSLFLVFFLMGGVAAKLRLLNPVWLRHIETVPVTLAAILAVVITIACFNTAYGFIPVALGNSMFGLLKLKASEWLGEISFSIYLLHTPILFAVFTLGFSHFSKTHSELAFDALMPVIAVLVVVLAGLTYTFIEKPMINVGKNLRHKHSEASAR
jgi:peptidoglycan/LPS O-acetylase OafA/YrhL